MLQRVYVLLTVCFLGVLSIFRKIEESRALTIFMVNGEVMEVILLNCLTFIAASLEAMASRLHKKDFVIPDMEGSRD